MLNRGSSLAVCLGLLVCGSTFGQQYKIATLAGNGTEGYNDSSDPTAAQFNNPNALAMDSKGVVYVADTGGERIRLISGGSVSTIAGTGTYGYTAATEPRPARIAAPAASPWTRPAQSTSRRRRTTWSARSPAATSRSSPATAGGL